MGIRETVARVATAAGGGERISPGRAKDLDLGSTGVRLGLAGVATRGGGGSHRLQASGGGRLDWIRNKEGLEAADASRNSLSVGPACKSQAGQKLQGKAGREEEGSDDLPRRSGGGARQSKLREREADIAARDVGGGKIMSCGKKIKK
jgi:hypothetical protein